MHGRFANAAALFQNHVVFASLDFEENGRVRPVIVIAQPEFKAIAIAVDSVPMCGETVGIEVKTEGRIRESRLQGAVFVNFQVTLHKVANAQRLILVHLIFQFVSLML